MKKVLATVLCASMMLGMVACGGKDSGETTTTPEAPKASKELVVYSPHPLEFIDPLVQEFESETGITVEVIAAGAGELLKRIESEVDNPQGDVMWGGSLGTMQGVADLFEPYTSANEDALFDEFKNVEGTITRFSNIPSVLMVNTNLIGDIEVNGYEDLLNPELKGKIAHADPAKSSSSFEHLVNTLYAMGEGDPEKGWDYIDKFAEALDGKLLSGSSAVYKGVADGEYTVGLTFEEGGAKYAQNLENAKLFIDFITGEKAQTMVATSLNRRSVRKDVAAAEGLMAYEDINLIKDDADLVAENKEAWIEKFRDIFTDK